MRRLALLLLLTIGTFFPAQTGLAQSTSPKDQASSNGISWDSDQTPADSSRAIAGVVLDPSGAAVSGAQVALTTTEGTAISSTTTDNTGSFHFEKLATGVYTIDDSASNTPTANPLSRVDLALRNQVTSLSETHIISPSLVNKATVGFSRGAFYFTGDSLVKMTGFVLGKPIGAVVVGGGTALNSATQITTAGTNAGSNLTVVRNLFTVEDQVVINHGIHQWNFGVWFERLQANDTLAQNQYGQASFSSLQSFLKGTVNTFTAIPSPTPLNWRSLEGAAYAEDTLKITPRLELRIGFRGEFTNGWNEAGGRASNYLFSSKGIVETHPHVGDSALTVNNARFLPAP